MAEHVELAQAILKLCQDGCAYTENYLAGSVVTEDGYLAAMTVIANDLTANVQGLRPLPEGPPPLLDEGGAS